VQEAFCCSDASEDSYLEREEVEQALTTTRTPGRCAGGRGRVCDARVAAGVSLQPTGSSCREGEQGALTAPGTIGVLSVKQVAD
jgi:hypothetical protein